MFKIDYIKLIYLDNSVEPTVYKFKGVNYIYGTNNVGKTAMVKVVDFVTAKDDFDIKSYDGLDNIEAIETCLVHDNDTLFLKRTKDNIYSYKKSGDSQYVETSDDLYKKEITYFINRGENVFLEDFYQYSNEHLTCRAFSFLNFLNEKDLGNISNLFMSADSYYNQSRIRKLISFLFNYKNIKRITELEKENERLEKDIKEYANNLSKYNYFFKLIQMNMSDLQLDVTDSLEEMKMSFIKFKRGYLRDSQNSKIPKGDLAILMRISCALSEEIKYQKNLLNQSTNLKSRNERAGKLLMAFREILNYDDSYFKYIEKIDAILEKQLQENDILSLKDFTKTIEAIEKKKYKIDQQIKECSNGLNKFEYEEVLKKIGIIEQSFEEISLIRGLQEIKEKEEILSKNKKEIQKLSKEFDNSILDKFNAWINNEYKELKDVTFSIEDNNLSGFKIKFNPIAVSISGEKLVEKGEKKESLTYNPGSNARMTTWQILAYLGLFNIIATFFKGLPIMKFMFIDGLNQPFDETESCYPNVCELIKKISISLGVQLFIVSTRNIKCDDNEKFIDISDGFNKMHNKNQ